MDEKVLYEGKPSIRLIWSQGFRAFVVMLFLFLFFGINTLLLASATNNYGAFWATLIIYILIFALILIYLYFLINTYKYKITDKGIYYSGGILTKREKFVPFFKVTNVDVLQTFIDQLLHIKRLGIQTASQGQSNIPEITFQGLESVEKPKEIILKYIEKNSK